MRHDGGVLGDLGLQRLRGEASLQVEDLIAGTGTEPANENRAMLADKNRFAKDAAPPVKHIWELALCGCRFVMRWRTPGK